MSTMRPTRRFSAGDVDRVKPWTLTREQTIDLMERRQEAAVMKYVREISRLSEEGNWQIEVPRKRARRNSSLGGKVAANEEPREAEKPTVVDFGKMNSAQIASVMQGEQAAMENRLEQKVATLRAEKRRRRYESVSF
ncbi:hypothetical protein FT663_02814 [Candidozyma haemuli var. vulneris]|uniref:Uncharacterized protein n=1 Tax=Candidozyma haemuli TaxID=45357 RepID=A0A2V1B141_9ASCO|nr:hypothetical protein CXQ85_003826 [[Candida] haemuloni]KAF3989267.1 hypothetical protein FT662_02911 [[Candida] haemuloni var. vulneris]KAF3991206.1 hypothetical protein FT663_02814 [[Candida] haemuloni var. vulneris]PVH23536.1 hypothetical protein CXQ85_003826 [[Candida] haemuloni]